MECWLTFIADIYGNEDEDDEDEDDPDWVNEEKQQFHTFRDKNGDGFLDREEVKDWLIPDEFNHLETEVTHLVRTSDVDQVCSRALPVQCIRNCSTNL